VSLYQFVGVVRIAFTFFAHPLPLRAGGGAFIEDPCRHGRLATNALRRSASFVLARIPFSLSTKARSSESRGEPNWLHQPCIRSPTSDHDPFSELPFREGGGRAPKVRSKSESRVIVFAKSTLCSGQFGIGKCVFLPRSERSHGPTSLKLTLPIVAGGPAPSSGMRLRRGK
jgi:hypothetical protein